jgi:hypothetical protein
MADAGLGSVDGADGADGAGGVAPGRRAWRWAGPVGLAVVVAALVFGAWLAVAGPGGGSAGRDNGGPAGRPPTPRFLLTAGGSAGAASGVPSWFQIRALTGTGRERLVESVRPPSPAAGSVQEILAGPAGTFLVLASRAEPCESRLYRFGLTGDGHPTGITAVGGGSTPALVAGLAVSPDGRRVAYTTAPCAPDQSAPPRQQPPRATVATNASVTVLDLATGARRTWSTGQPSIVGEIAWARDNHTLGFTLAGVIHQAPAPPAAPLPGGAGRLAGDTVGEVTVRALDTDAPGADLLAGRVLFRQPAGSATVTSAVMSLDGRTGYGTMRDGQPPTTMLFSFTEGQSIRVTSTFAPAPNGAAPMLAVSTGDGPRYACLSGIDAFGRLIDGTLATNSPGHRGCDIAYDTPR